MGLYIDLKPELITKRKVKKLRVTAEILDLFLKSDGYVFRINSEIPTTAILARVFLDNDGSYIVFVFYDDSFDEISEYGIIPYFDSSVSFTSLNVTNIV